MSLETIVQLAFSGVVTIATVAYVVLTRQLVRETRALRNAETEPQLTLGMEPSRSNVHVVEVILRNVGRGPAFDVKLSTPNDWAIGRSRVQELGIFQHGTPCIVPGQEIRGFIGQGPELWEKGNRRLVAQASYRGATGKIFQHEVVASLEPYAALGLIGSAEEKMATSLEKIERSLDRLASGHRRLQIDVHTSADREEETRRREQWIEQVRAESAQEALLPADAPPTDALKEAPAPTPDVVVLQAASNPEGKQLSE